MLLNCKPINLKYRLFECYYGFDLELLIITNYLTYTIYTQNVYKYPSACAKDEMKHKYQKLKRAISRSLYRNAPTII